MGSKVKTNVVVKTCISKALYEYLKDVSLSEDISISAMIRQAIKDKIPHSVWHKTMERP
ncbi:MAG: hypothetical protein ACOWWR_13630 [Eubacteriales bacterium]